MGGGREGASIALAIALAISGCGVSRERPVDVCDRSEGLFGLDLGNGGVATLAAFPDGDLALAADVEGPFELASVRIEPERRAIVVARLDARSGAVRWARPVADTGAGVVRDVAASAHGVALVGERAAPDRVSELVGFVIALGADGSERFERRLDPDVSGGLQPLAVDIGDDGRVVVLAARNGLASGPLVLLGHAPDASVAFEREVLGATGVRFDVGAVRLEPSGGIVVAAPLHGVLELGGRAHEGAVLLLRLDAEARYVESRAFGAPGVAQMRWTGDTLALAGGADGGLYVAGSVDGGLDATSGSERDVFVLAVDSTLAPRWQRSFVAPDYQSVGAIDVSASGLVGVAGLSYGSDGSVLACSPDTDAAMTVAVLDAADGTPLFARCFGALFAGGLSIEVGDDGALAVSGIGGDPLDLGTGPLRLDGLGGFVGAIRPLCF